MGDLVEEGILVALGLKHEHCLTVDPSGFLVPSASLGTR